MLPFVVLADRAERRRSGPPRKNTSESATLSWINTDSLAVAEISSQRDEERSHGTTELKVGKTACHLERDRTAGAGETSGSNEK